MFWIIISFLISNFRNLEKFGNEILKASPVDSLKEEQKTHFQFPFGYKCSVNVAKPFNFLFPNNYCLAWKWLFLYGLFQSQLREYWFHILYKYFLSVLFITWWQQEIRVYRKKETFKRNVCRFWHRFSFMCKFRPLIVSHYKKPK